MTNSTHLQRIQKSSPFRGFRNIFRKENQRWWGTRRWWVNAILWPVLLGGLVFMMLFILPPIAEVANDPNVAEAGGPIPFAMEMGRTVFFEMGTMALAIGVIILTQDAIVAEKESGVAEWLLAKPLTRSSYLLSKLAANLLAVLVLLIVFPSLIVYGLFFARTGEIYPLGPFLSGIGVIGLHTLFYLVLTLTAGTFFSNQAPILGITIGSLLGGSLIGGFAKPLLYVTPWMLGKVASGVGSQAALPGGMIVFPIASTALWCLILTLVAIWRFRHSEF